MFQFPFKKKDAPGSTRQFDESWDLDGMRINCRPGIAVYVSITAAVLILLFFLFFLLAGETGSEWIYLQTSSLLTVLLIGAILPLLQILDTKVDTIIPGEAESLDRVPIELQISRKICNDKWASRLPLRWLRLQISLEKQDGRHAAGFVEPCVAAEVGKEQTVFTLTTPLRRGQYKFHGLEVASCFPFSMVWWLAKVPTNLLQGSLIKEAGALTVYPKLMPMRQRFLQTTGAGGEAIGQLNERNRPAQESCAVRGLRNYRIGDSPRWVHWPSTARTGRILVKEFDSTSSPQYFVSLDWRAPWHSQEQFELAVCLVYSIVHCESPDTRFELLIAPSDELMDVYGLPSGLTRSREILARVQSHPAAVLPGQEESLEEASLKRVEQIFREQLRSHPGSILFSILPGSSTTAVNLIESTLDKHGRPTVRQGRPQRHHILSSQRVTDQHIVTLIKDKPGLVRGQVIARISHLDQISIL
jgi:uncharacterized protein (DUF58 family)